MSGYRAYSAHKVTNSLVGKPCHTRQCVKWDAISIPAYKPAKGPRAETMQRPS